MLARLGLGPAPFDRLTASAGGAKDCEDGAEGCDGARERLVQGGGGVEEIPEDMCWGYEKNCSKEKRLFVPKCEGAAQPW